MKPVTSNPQPATRNQQPVTSNPQPATSNQQPVTSNLQHFILILSIALFMFGCGNQQNKSTTESSPAVVLTVDELYEKAPDLTDKEVLVKGTVMHVCMHGGERCFIMGSNENIQIRIEAGEKIGSFSQELMGSDLEVLGILKEVKTEADAHNPGREHGNEEAHEEDAETEEAHRIIAESQEAAEVVYFIEGLKSKEVTNDEL